MKPTVYVKAGSLIPKQGTPESAGYDVEASEDILIPSGKTVIVNVNFSLAMPSNLMMLVVPRSGYSLKNPHLRMSNSIGVIDADYRGKVGVILHNTADFGHMIEQGTRIAQVIFVPVVHPNFVIADELPESTRGDGGFGSTGMSYFSKPTLRNGKWVGGVDYDKIR